MSKTGPIILIEDDEEDMDILKDILEELGVRNKLVWFTHTEEAFEYLKNTTLQPFIIFSDINLPGDNGIAFKKRVDEDEQLRKKSIPFIFYSTSVSPYIVNEAYTKLTVQGFFQKANTYEEIRANIKLIVAYWSACRHPNSR